MSKLTEKATVRLSLDEKKMVEKMCKARNLTQAELLRKAIRGEFQRFEEEKMKKKKEKIDEKVVKKAVKSC